MLTLTTAAWFLAISSAASLGYVLGAVMATGARADTEIKRKPRRVRTRISRGQRSNPDVVMISPTEFRAVKS